VPRRNDHLSMPWVGIILNGPLFLSLDKRWSANRIKSENVVIGHNIAIPKTLRQLPEQEIENITQFATEGLSVLLRGQSGANRM